VLMASWSWARGQPGAEPRALVVLRAADAGHALCGSDDWHECGAGRDLALARQQEMGAGAWQLGAEAGGGEATRVERERAAWLRDRGGIGKFKAGRGLGVLGLFYWALLCWAAGYWAAFVYRLFTRFSVNQTEEPAYFGSTEPGTDFLGSGSFGSGSRFFRFGSRFFVPRATANGSAAIN
jgi:hypothetical protein